MPVLVTTAASPRVVNSRKPRRGSRLATAAQSSGAVVATTSGADYLTGDLNVFGDVPRVATPSAKASRRDGVSRRMLTSCSIERGVVGTL